MERSPAPLKFLTLKEPFLTTESNYGEIPSFHKEEPHLLVTKMLTFFASHKQKGMYARCPGAAGYETREDKGNDVCQLPRSSFQL